MRREHSAHGASPRFARGHPATWILVTLLVVAALGVRLIHLDASGFSEDELEKYEATRAYARHQFAADADHPMLMKLGAWGARAGADTIDQRSGRRWHVADETAVRLPSVVAGALTTAALYALAAALFEPAVGVVAAALWALDINAIAINRIAKEDSLLVLCLTLAAWLYERAKATGRTDPDGAQRWFRASGAAWGLMVASKYMPYYLGIHVLFFRLAERHAGRNRAHLLPFFAAMGAAFLAGNFAIVLPAAWPQIVSFLGEQRLTHTGYFFDGQIWSNRLSATPFGVPMYFYALALWTKMPPSWIAACLIGGVALLRKARGRGPLFVAVFLTLTLIPYSLIASKFLRYLLPVHLVIDMVIAVAIVAIARSLSRTSGKAPALLTAAVAACFLTPALVVWGAHAEHPALYRNTFGARHSPNALVFPHDELYDAGVREAATQVARVAGAEAAIYSDAPHVTAFYLRRAGRADLPVRPLSGTRLDDSDEERWVLVQDGRRYFESRAAIALLERSSPTLKIGAGGFDAVRIYRTGGQAPAFRTPDDSGNDLR